MQPLVITLLIGTAFAMVNAAPAQDKLQSLQAIVEGDDDLAKMSSWFRRAIGGLNYALNGMGKKIAEQQEDINAEAQKFRFGKFIKHAGRALGGLGGLFGDGDEEEPAVLEGDDDEAKAQFFGGLVRAVAPHVLGSILGNEMQLQVAELQDNDEAEAQRRKSRFGKFIKGAASTIGGALLGSLFGDGDEEEPAVLEGDDDEAKAQFFGGLVRAVAPHVLGSILGNEMQLAKLQENSKAEVQDDNDDDDDDDDARKALLRAIQAMMQDDDDMATA